MCICPVASWHGFLLIISTLFNYWNWEEIFYTFQNYVSCLRELGTILSPPGLNKERVSQPPPHTIICFSFLSYMLLLYIDINKYLVLPSPQCIVRKDILFIIKIIVCENISVFHSESSTILFSYFWNYALFCLEQITKSLIFFCLIFREIIFLPCTVYYYFCWF